MTTPRLFGWLLVALASAFSAEAQTPKEGGGGKQKGKTQNIQSLIALPEGFVQYSRVPQEGILPCIARGGDRIAVLYFKGEPEAGDLFIAFSSDEARTFGDSLRVNSAAGTVSLVNGRHSGSIGIGPDGRASVAWVSNEARPTLFHVRAASEGGLGPVEELGSPPGLAASTAVAIDGEGRICVVHVATGPSGEEGELGAGVWLQRSESDQPFSGPTLISPESEGVSMESAIAAHVDELSKTFFIAYRAAAIRRPEEAVRKRGMRLLWSSDSTAFEPTLFDKDSKRKDPASSMGLSQDPETTLATWDVGGRVFWSLVQRNLNKMNLPVESKSDRKTKCFKPAAGSGSGEVLLAWLERSIEDPAAPVLMHWKVWQREGRLPLGEGTAPEPAGESAPCVLPRASGGFTILF